MNGGQLIQLNSKSAIFGNPKIPCNGQKINNIEISKIFINDKDRNNEYYKKKEFINNMRDIMNKKVLSNYFLLPIEKCQIYKKTLKYEPFTQEHWELDRLNIHKYPDIIPQIIYPKMNETYKTLMSKIDTNFIYLKELLKKLYNIIYILKVLHNADYVHLNITEDNIIENKNGRLLLTDIPLKIDKHMRVNVSKLGKYPSSALFLFNKMKSLNIETVKHLQRKYKVQSDDITNFKSDIELLNIVNLKDIYGNIFDIGYNNEQKREIKDMMNNLIEQKLLYILHIDKLLPIYSKLFLERLNENIKEKRISYKDLYKRIDYYMVGMLILRTINQFLYHYINDYNIKITKSKLSKNNINYLFNFIKIGYNLCNDDNIKLNIEDIMKKYRQLIYKQKRKTMRKKETVSRTRIKTISKSLHNNHLINIY